MSENTIHNLDQRMIDLRRVLSQGRKRMGLLLGAGVPVSMKVNPDGAIDENGEPIIPAINELTEKVVEKLESNEKEVVEKIVTDISKEKGIERPNIEFILTRVRQIAEAIGSNEIYGYDSPYFNSLAEKICMQIGEFVGKPLPHEPNAYKRLVSWIGGIQREHPVELFTPNYDLLLEEAFERNEQPFFDGFVGSHRPFFDPSSVGRDDFPSHWSRIWKLHGSLGWEDEADKTVRTGSRKAANLIYPDHRKYDKTTKLPYSAFFERLRNFLSVPDAVLLCSGFSFSDAHITTVIADALVGNPHSAVFAFQFGKLTDERQAMALARNRHNFSLFARDGAIVGGLEGKWRIEKSKHEEWLNFRQTFWSTSSSGENGEFILGDFSNFSRFLQLSQIIEIDQRVVFETAPKEENNEANQ